MIKSQAEVYFVYSYLDDPKGGLGQYEYQLSRLLGPVMSFQPTKIKTVKSSSMRVLRLIGLDAESFFKNNPMLVAVPQHENIVIHFSHQFMGLAVIIARLRGLRQKSRPKIVITVHDLFAILSRRDRFLKTLAPPWRWTDYIVSYLNLVGISLADQIIADSSTAATTICEALPRAASKISVIHLGWDGPHQQQSTSYKRARYVLYVGSLHPRKNIVTLINAVRLLHNRGSNLELILAGSSRTDMIPKEIDGFDYIHILGHVSDERLESLYYSALMLAFPSYFEGFGLPLIEAMGHGCPVVASDIPVFRELARDAAIFVPPTDVEMWATAIEDLSNSEEKQSQLSQRGLERSREFSWDETASKTATVYQKLME